MESQSIMVHGMNMHYLSEGKGKTLLFLHGVPGTSSMWGPIISKMSSRAHCIAVDLIGLGQSDKPRLDYSIEDHYLFLSGFISELNLDNIILVLNGWGSIVGLDYARQKPDKISGVVFADAYLRLEKNRQDISLVFEKLKTAAQADPDKLRKMLTPAFWRTVQDNPYVNPESNVISIIESYSAWLEKTPVKKLLIHGGPGFITTKTTVNWASRTFPNLTTVDLGAGVASMSDAMATKFSEALLNWL